MYFNGGQSETYVDTDGNLVSAGDNYLGNINTSQGENIYTTNAVYIDLDDYAWVRYMIHKDTNDMLLNVRMADGTIKTYKGILGAGIYYLKDDNDTIFSKIDTTVAKSSSFGRIQDLYKKVIVNDMEKTALLQQNYSASQLSMLDTHSLPSKYMTNLSSIYLYAINDTNNYIEDYNLYNFNDNIIYCDSSLYDIGHNYNIETKSTDVLNYRYLYGASTTGFIKIGPISYSNMTGLLVAGEQLFAKDNPGSGTFHVTEDVQFLDFDIDVDRIEIEVVNGNTINDNIYYLKYNTTTQAIPIEAARFFDLLEYEINSGGVNVPLLYKSAIFSCLLESTLSLVFKVPQVGLYYCIGVSLFCVFVYITNPTEHHVKTWQSAKLYFNAGILIDSINQIGVKIKNIYLRLIRYFNIHKQQDEDSTEDVVD